MKALISTITAVAFLIPATPRAQDALPLPGLYDLKGQNQDNANKSIKGVRDAMQDASPKKAEGPADDANSRGASKAFFEQQQRNREQEERRWQKIVQLAEKQRLENLKRLRENPGDTELRQKMKHEKKALNQFYEKLNEARKDVDHGNGKFRDNERAELHPREIMKDNARENVAENSREGARIAAETARGAKAKEAAKPERPASPRGEKHSHGHCY